MIFKQDLVLSTRDVVLKTLASDTIDSFTSLAADKKIWQHAKYALEQPDIFRQRWFNKALCQMQAGTRWPFAIECAQELVGSSSYYDIDSERKCLNIGYTWYHPKFWGTYLNSTVKLLLLTYAFETAKYHSVGFSVDKKNQRSCAAMRKLGIKKIGMSLKRNSVIFALTKDEWPTIKIHLQNISQTKEGAMNE